MWRFAYLALRDILHYWGRTILAVAGIAVIVTVYTTLASVAEGLGNIAGEAGSARNIILVDARTVLDDNMAIPPEVVDDVATVPGVTRVVPMFYQHVRIDETTVHVRAMPLDSYRQAHSPTLVAGQWLEQADGAMVGDGLARLAGWAIGDTVSIAGEEVAIVGLFQADGAKNSELWLSLDDGRRILNRPVSYSHVLVLVAPDADADAVLADLQSHPAFDNVQPFFEQSYFEQANQSMAQVRDIVFLVSMIALMAIAFGVFNVASMTASEKRREVALLKAVGVSRRQIVGIFVVEGLVLALGGFLLGVMLGAGVVTWLGSSSAINLADVAIQPNLSIGIVIFGAIITLALGLIGAWLPAQGAANTSVAEVLRG